MGHQASATGPDEAQTAATEIRNAGAGRAPGQGRQMGKAQDLTLNNSLTKNKDLFKPLDKHGVTWYTCGPTVYDSAHLDHARYYVTMDMLRRVMETHFHYKIKYIMNVTDIDDKIIRRARLIYLRDRYLKSTPDDSKVLQEVLEVMTEAVQKQQSTRDEVASVRGCNEGRLKDLEKRLSREDKQLHKKQQDLKDAQSLRDKWEESSDSPAESDASPGIRDKLIELGGDHLAEKLDILLAGEVIDHKVITDHAKKFETEFFEDLETLGCKTPSMVMRVTKYIPEITAYIDKIHQNGMAYSSKGSVYFDTQAFEKNGHTYGKMRPSPEESQQKAEDGEANFATQDKRNPRDFALWKAAKPGEPSWPSPQSAQDAAGTARGRPGWHIECSVMASHALGQSTCMDIHSGGVDLAFPHHTNEVAQAEAYLHHEHMGQCCQWVRYFLHAGHLDINGCKMSKSEKNFITIRKALEWIDARVLRLMFATMRWEKPMSFTVGETEAEARRRDDDFKRFFARTQALLAKLSSAARLSATEGLDKGEEAQQIKTDLSAALTSARSTVDAALLDSINLSVAINALFVLVESANGYMDELEKEALAKTGKDLQPCAVLLREVTDYVAQILSEFGIEGYAFAVPAAVEAFAGFRGSVRDYAKSGLANSSEPRDALKSILQAAERVRDEDMPALGVRLEDESWIIWEIPDINSEDHTSGGAEGDAKSRAAALQASAGFCCTAHNHAESSLAGLSKPKNALSHILQAADRVWDEDMPDLGIQLEDESWIIKEISEIDSKDPTPGGAEGDAESKAAAIEAFAGFRCTVRHHAKSGLASLKETRDALNNILQAADRVRDEDMPELGFRLDDCAEGSWLPWFIMKMSAVEQREFRDPEAAAKAKEEMKQKGTRDAEQERQSKNQDKLKRLEKAYASLQATEDPRKKVKHIKDVWAALKPLKKGPEDHTFGPEERQVVEDILSGSRKVHEKQLQGFEASWAVLNRAYASDAEKQKAEKELLHKVKEALPEATEPWLVQVVSEFRTSW